MPSSCVITTMGEKAQRGDMVFHSEVFSSGLQGPTAVSKRRKGPVASQTE